MPSIVLKPDRDRSVRQRHPWIFSGAIARADEITTPGETVEVYSSAGELLGRAAYNPASNISARMWSWDPGEKIDAKFFRSRLQRAMSMRMKVIPESETDAVRLVFAESDGLPGFIVDAYAQILVVQCLTAGADYWRKTFVDLLVDLAGPGAVVERSDVEVRALEGLQPRVGILYGSKPVERLVIHEHSLDFYVNVLTGQKTGFYIDQRRNRDRLRKATYGRRVLNCFSYTGAFSVYALAGGADHVLSIDSSADALAWGEENLTLNGFLPERASWKHADVFQELRLLRDKAEMFDVIVLDPPKFAPTKAQAERAARGYKDINLLAMKLLKPGGLLYTFSCSGGISADLFQKIIAGAAFDAGVNGRIIERLSQSPDHPVSVFFPEGEYLKGLVVEVNT